MSVFTIMQLLCWIAGCNSLGASAQLSNFLRNLTANEYDIRLRPTQSVTNVSIQIGVLEMGPLDLSKMAQLVTWKEYAQLLDLDPEGCPVKYTVLPFPLWELANFQSYESMVSEILLRMWWRDPRLAYDNTSQIIFSGDPASFIWVPDVYVFNAISTKRHRALMPNVRTIIGPSGYGYISLRLSIEFSCEMDFKYYPMDTQICAMNLESYSYRSHELFLQWISQKEPVEFTRKVHLLGYEVSIDESKYGHLDYDSITTFSHLQANFRIKRVFFYYLYRVYIPSILIVVLSWSTFWIPPSAVPARVTVIVTDFLTSMVVFHESSSGIPPVSYHTALEVFALFNCAIILMAMLEYLVLLKRGNIMNEDSKFGLAQLSAPGSKTNKAFSNEEYSASTNENLAKIWKEILQAGEKYYNKPNILDQYSRMLFPLGYCIFLSIYFTYYLMQI